MSALGSLRNDIADALENHKQVKATQVYYVTCVAVAHNYNENNPLVKKPMDKLALDFVSSKADKDGRPCFAQVLDAPSLVKLYNEAGYLVTDTFEEDPEDVDMSEKLSLHAMVRLPGGVASKEATAKDPLLSA